MTPEELVASLAPVRVPESFARFGLQDAFAAVALGLVAGLLLSAVLRVVTRRRPRRAETARQAIAALATCNPQSRLTGLAALLRDYGGTAPPKLDAALYDPAVRFDPAPLETAILKAARSRAR